MQSTKVGLALVLCLGLGCASGPKQPTTDELAAALESDIESLRDKVDEIKSREADFSDGSTNWKEIVSDLDSSTSELDSEMESVEASMSKLKTRLEAQ